MAREKRDVLIHFDEDRGVIACYSTSESSVSRIRDAGFPLEVPVSTYVDAGPDEAERMMGAGIFALLELHGNSTIGLRDYEGETRAPQAGDMSELEVSAAGGDPESQYFLSMELFHRGVREKAGADIASAEVWLLKSAHSGFSDAVEYLQNHWERDKASALRGIGSD